MKWIREGLKIFISGAVIVTLVKLASVILTKFPIVVYILVVFVVGLIFKLLLNVHQVIFK